MDKAAIDPDQEKKNDLENACLFLDQLLY